MGKVGKRRFAKNPADVRHFRLVTRSQHDANIDDPSATPLVLEPFLPPGEVKRTGIAEDELLRVPEYLHHLGPEVFGLGVHAELEDEEYEEGDEGVDADDRACEVRLQQLEEHDCYFPRDGYDYDKHLRRVTQVPKKEPGVKASVGMKAKASGAGAVVMEAPDAAAQEGPTAAESAKLQLQAAPRTQEEDALLRALEFADEYDECDDDLMDGLLHGGANNLETSLWGPVAEENANLPDLAQLRIDHAALLRGAAEMDSGMDEEGSHVVSNDEDSHVVGDDQFDQFLAEEYGDDDIGAAELDEIEGPRGMDACEEAIEEYLKCQKDETKHLMSVCEPQRQTLDQVPRCIEETKALAERYYAVENSDDEETTSGEETEDPSRLWDCETVLTTLSNISNRPGKIGRIKVVKAPAGEKATLKEVREEEEADEDDIVDLPDVITVRPKDESAEDKRARKAGVKEMRRLCRVMKKESKEVYKNEEKKLVQHGNSADVQKKMKYVKL